MEHRTHPALIVAAIAVTLASVIGIAAMTGSLPSVSRSPTAVELLAGAAGGATAEPKASIASPAAPVTPEVRTAEPRAAKKMPVPPSRRERTDPLAVRAADPASVRTDPPSPAVHGDSATAPYAHAPGVDPWPSVSPVPAKPACRECGVVESVRQVETPGVPSGVGAVAGGVVGGLIGSQMGGGNARHAMTVIGAVGGAIAGHQIERSARKTTAWDVVVRFGDGSTQAVRLTAPPAWKPGDHVRISNGILVSDI